MRLLSPPFESAFTSRRLYEAGSQCNPDLQLRCAHTARSSAENAISKSRGRKDGFGCMTLAATRQIGLEVEAFLRGFVLHATTDYGGRKKGWIGCTRTPLFSSLMQLAHT